MVEYTHPTRIPRAVREDLTERDRRIWDVIDQTRGGVWGPYSCLMHIPDLADRVASVGEFLRFKGRLSGADRELAILCAARAGGSRFEWLVHEPVAREAGTRHEAIELLRADGDLSALSARETLIVSVIRALLEERAISNGLFERAQVEFDREEIIELVTIAGFYQMLAFVIAAFDVPDPQTGSQSF